MELIVNGKSMDLPDGLTIEGLLARLGVPREFTAVALNREVASRSQYAQIVLRAGDRVEVVRPMGGG